MKNALWAHQWAGWSPLVDGLTSRLWKELVTMKVGQGKPINIKREREKKKKAEKYGRVSKGFGTISKL